MSRREQDLAEFRRQILPEKQVPPRLFWFVMGVGLGIGLAIADANKDTLTWGNEWWSVVGLGVLAGALIALILVVPVWIIWYVVIDSIVDIYRERKERKEAEWWATHYDEEGNWIGPEETSDVVAEGPSADSSIGGWCEVLTDPPGGEYPLMILTASPDGVSLAALTDGPRLPDLEWADLWYWELVSEHDVGGDWAWVMAVNLDADKLPDDVVGLAVRAPIDRKRWQDLLIDSLPFNPGEEE